MINTLKKFMVGVVGATFIVGAMAPVTAAPLMPTSQIVGSENIINVRDHRRHRDRHWRGHHSGPRHWRGHRGHREYRRGYRRHNDGWWYPLAAFGAGAIIGGAIASPPPPPPVYRAPAYRQSNSHVQWCYDRYRSYRSSDNSFQPYNGPRKQCRSPYG